MPGTVDDRIVIIDIDEEQSATTGPVAVAAQHACANHRQTFRRLRHHGTRPRRAVSPKRKKHPRPAYSISSLLNQRRTDVVAELQALAEAADGNLAFAESLIARDVVTGFVFKDSVSEGEPRTSGALPMPVIAASDLASVDVPFVSAAGYTGSLVDLQENAIDGGFFDSPLIDSDGVFQALAAGAVVRRRPLPVTGACRRTHCPRQPGCRPRVCERGRADRHQSRRRSRSAISRFRSTSRSRCSFPIAARRRAFDSFPPRTF